MKSITNLKRGLLQLALVWLFSLSASAQVPSTMDYQIMATNPKTGQVLANKNLTGTWGGSRIDDKDKAIHYTFVLEANGKFVYTCKGYETEVYTGTWKINNLGFITFNITSGPYLHGKYVLFSVYDKEDNSLYLGGNDDFLGDGLTLTKQK